MNQKSKHILVLGLEIQAVITLVSHSQLREDLRGISTSGFC